MRRAYVFSDRNEILLESFTMNQEILPSEASWRVA